MGVAMGYLVVDCSFWSQRDFLGVWYAAEGLSICGSHGRYGLLCFGIGGSLDVRADPQADIRAKRIVGRLLGLAGLLQQAAASQTSGLLTRSEFAAKQLGGPYRSRVSNLLRDTCYLKQITSGYFLWKWSYTTTPRPSVELNKSCEGRP